MHADQHTDCDELHPQEHETTKPNIASPPPTYTYMCIHTPPVFYLPRGGDRPPGMHGIGLAVQEWLSDVGP